MPAQSPFTPLPPPSSSLSLAGPAQAGLIGGETIDTNVVLALNITLADTVAMARKLLFGGLTAFSAANQGWLAGEVSLPGNHAFVPIPFWPARASALNASGASNTPAVGGVIVVASHPFDVSFGFNSFESSSFSKEEEGEGEGQFSGASKNAQDLQEGFMPRQTLFAVGPGFSNFRLRKTPPAQASRPPAGTAPLTARFLVLSGGAAA